MTGLFPLASKVVAWLSIAEFITGMLKAVNIHSKYSILCFAMFGTCELVLGVFIGTSIISQVSKLKYGHSKALYLMAVASDICFLFLDLCFVGRWIWKEKSSTRKRIEWNPINIKEAVKTVFWFVVMYCIPLALFIDLLTRLKSSISEISVSELVDSTTPPTIFWISFGGFISLFPSFCFYSLYMFLENGVLRPTGNDWLYVSFFVAVVVGLTLIGYSAKSVSEQFVRGYAFISLTSFPPVASFLITSVKIWTIDELSSESQKEDSELPYVESNQRNAK